LCSPIQQLGRDFRTLHAGGQLAKHAKLALRERLEQRLPPPALGAGYRPDSKARISEIRKACVV
jgi:hypothetical protein